MIRGAALVFVCSGALALAGCAPVAAVRAGDGDVTEEDPYLWLEDVDGDRALRWVRSRNRATQRSLAAAPSFKALRAELLEVFESQERIPYVTKLGDHYYNFWRDTTHPRGLWRRTTLAEYRRETPAWEPVLDLDALAEEENENWVLNDFVCREPDYDRCLVRLSRGGADAVVVREFDLAAKTFVTDGFALPEAKCSVAWVDADSVFVATDFGPGTMTDSGYPRIVKLWRRGTPLDAASTIFEADVTDVQASAYADLTRGHETQLVWRARDFYRHDLYVRRDGELLPLAKPADAEATVHLGRLFIELKSDWTVAGQTYRAGSLVSSGLDDFLQGGRSLDVLFEPSASTSLAGFAGTRNHVLVNVLDNVRNRVYVATAGNSGWTRRPLFAADGYRTLRVEAVDPTGDDRYFVHSTDYLTPPTLSLGAVGEEPVVLKRSPAYFDAAGLTIAQHWAVSADGTRIPYFQVGSGVLDSPRPTLLYGYGGFESALVPRYSAGVGISWLARGGVYVVANIRGGGEFGPAWHQAALKANRIRAFQDFIAVAEDLIRRGVARSDQLGIVGGSNGGLLVGNMLTMRPELFGAVVAQVPLLDMRRYHRLLAGASWMAEFGNPDDDEDWAYLRNFSPYHNVRADAAYPPLLVHTSTRDDRVHPGHARKMVAKMRDMGHNVTYYENIEGGHGGAANNAQSAYMWALVYEFLWRELKVD